MFKCTYTALLVYHDFFEKICIVRKEKNGQKI